MMKMNKKVFLIVLIFLQSSISVYGNGPGILLPPIPKKIGMDIIEVIETRTGVRNFNGTNISMNKIGTILWAGTGLILVEGSKSVHGYDVISGATSKNRFAVPYAWGRSYLIAYIMLEQGAYRYDPLTHKLNYVTNKNMLDECGANTTEAYGIILIVADFKELPKSDYQNNQFIAYLSAGNAIQNMCLAGTAMNVQMLIQTSMKKKFITKELKLKEEQVPLVILPFGHAK